jgi:hypothetical protein
MLFRTGELGIRLRHLRRHAVDLPRSRAVVPFWLVTVGALLPATPLARTLGFQPLPGLFFASLALMVACYPALIEIGKRWFYRTATAGPAIRHRHPGYRLLRRAARFTTADSLPDRAADDPGHQNPRTRGQWQQVS